MDTKGIDLDVHASEIFVLMGPSGSGKTVQLKHLIGLKKADQGEVLIEGQPIQSPEVPTRCRGIHPQPRLNHRRSLARKT
jgi:ABC-type sugar transport system ATPase subunit